MITQKQYYNKELERYKHKRDNTICLREYQMYSREIEHYTGLLAKLEAREIGDKCN